MFVLLLGDASSRLDRQNFSLLLGNDTSGANDSFSLSLCNGPLKRSTEYKSRLAVLLSFIGLRMLIGGCPLQGCRYAISKGFQTSGPGGGGGRSLGWNVSFSANSLVHLDQVRRSSLRSRSSLDRNLFLCSSTKRDVERRVLMNCRNWNDKLNNIVDRRSEIEDEDATFDRYANIPSRGLCQQLDVFIPR